MTEVQRLQRLIEEEKKVRADALVAQRKALKLAEAFGQYLLHNHLPGSTDSSVLDKELSTTFAKLLM